MLEPEEVLETTDIGVDTEGFTLILFNDSYHDFDEVTKQLVKATGYDYQRAEAITMEAHNKGRAEVLKGELQRCLKAQAILEEINLKTSIEVNV
jgi:ATP-dependent Clp protease adapter protein ClpS